jgi:hypothetical protein
MPSPLSRLRLSLRHRFAALGIVGALVVVLPLAQVLRYQDAELKALVAQQAALDPLLLASAAQRAVLDHQPLAAQVLRGQAEVEPRRQLLQGDVDERVFRLDMAVTVLGDPRAMLESDALRQDWHGLAMAVQARRTTPAASDTGHRLLVEQLLQVVDLLTLGAWTPDGDDAALRQLALHAQRLLPRLAVGLATLATAPSGTVAAPEGKLAASVLARQFDALAGAAEAGAAHPDRSIAAAAQALAAQARQGADAARTWAGGGAQAGPALASLHTLHAALPEALAAVLRPGLQAGVQRLQRRQRLTLAWAAMLMLCGGLLARRLWPGTPVTAGAARALQPAPQAPAAARVDPAPKEATFALLSGLRGNAGAPRRRDAGVTLPPED